MASDSRRVGSIWVLARLWCPCEYVCLPITRIRHTNEQDLLLVDELDVVKFEQALDARSPLRDAPAEVNQTSSGLERIPLVKDIAALVVQTCELVLRQVSVWNLVE